MEMPKTAAPKEGLLHKRQSFPWALTFLIVNGLMMTVVFAILSYAQPRGLTEQTTFTTLAPYNSNLGNDDKSRQMRNQVGLPAPDFTLKTMNGGSLTLSVFRGKAVLINFWASWCLPCQTEAPNLERVYETYKDQGFVIFGVDSTIQDTWEDIRTFIQAYNVTYPILIDETGDVTQDLYVVLGLPMSVFVDRQGGVARVYYGALSAEQLDEYVGEILK